ncbi:Vinorine synthase [Thalictrum thalictroides]|uniref:Vinorine synthase n=1 Tax=Thalictrum thalictroides TaxID=46969 RepID=A0A7J6XC22_THATH|nr:Vinorine synthase [Thalictrum thalictroides]
MTFTVEIIAKQTIKPSSPTPDNFRTLKLSLLDQFVPAVHVPLVLFYSSNADTEENENRLDHLKKSLSEILTYYYPLAGRIDGNDSISCNDEGIDFFKARANGHLNELLVGNWLT